ncbi:MAG: methyl-accepting chemotaxis protein [Nitrospira sp.]|nr:methyl-accepting chemotaxis protein [Nitrospira sp.]
MGLDVELLESSFKLVAPKGDALVTRFYERLFKKYPSVKPLFKKTSIKEQKKKLLASLVLVIQNLRRPDKLTPVLQDMGARHVGYGAKPAHYDAVGENLLAVLGEFAGSAWTPQVKQAWTEAYEAIKTIMLAGAERAQSTQGAKTMSKAKEKKDASAGADMLGFYLGALDQSQNNILLCDRNLVITYANSTAKKTLVSLEAEIKKVLPKFNASSIVGVCIDDFHVDPSKQRRILSNPANMPHRADIQIGPLTLSLLVTAIMSPTGEYMGNALEWADVTEKRRLETEMSRLKASLDNARSNVLVCDRSYTIVYANNQSVTTLRRLESDIQKVMPGFSVAKVVGSNIDQYHKNPAQQRRLLDNPQNLPYRTEIKIGPLTLDLAVAAIMSEKGDYLGNVVEWADVSAQKKAQIEIDKLIGAAAAGQLSERINAEEFEGFFKTLSEGVNKMLDAVVTPLHEAQMVLTAMAANDLTKTMTGHYQGEFEQMKSSLNGAMSTLSAAISTVRDGAESVTAGAEQITKGNEDLSQRTSEQASALEETSASMEEMTSTVKQNADNAKQANQLAIAARDIADKGGAVTVRAVGAMGEINKSSKKIADIITVIDEIAFQTNLLALNAAVEAARAGEHGRGFAVVAAEVRNLAQRSATAAKEIKGLINESIQRVNDGSELVNQSGKTLEEIVSSVKRVTDIIAEITAASQEQAQGIDQVNKAIMQMDETTQQNAALVEETTSASQSMKDQAQELMRQVEVFKVETNGGHREANPRPSTEKTAVKAGPTATKPPLKKPGFSSKPGDAKVPAGVAAGNGHDRRKKDDDFEEF